GTIGRLPRLPHGQRCRARCHDCGAENPNWHVVSALTGWCEPSFQRRCAGRGREGGARDRNKCSGTVGGRTLTDLVVRGGTVVAPEGAVTADIAIEDGRISAIASELPGAAREISARGLTVLPGVIDIHVHFNEPGRTEWEGAASGSRALAAGGGTLFFDMPLNSSPCTIGPAEFDQKRAALERSSRTDFALWGGIVPGNNGALAELAAHGAIGFKAFMTDSGLPEFPRSDDLTLYEGMREAARLGLPVAVHAESDEFIKSLTARVTAAGVTGIKDYLSSRPVLAEVAAIQRAALLAAETGVKLHIVHVSSGRGVAAAVEARA